MSHPPALYTDHVLHSDLHTGLALYPWPWAIVLQSDVTNSLPYFLQEDHWEYGSLNRTREILSSLFRKKLAFHWWLVYFILGMLASWSWCSFFCFHLLQENSQLNLRFTSSKCVVPHGMFWSTNLTSCFFFLSDSSYNFFSFLLGLFIQMIFFLYICIACVFTSCLPLF